MKNITKSHLNESVVARKNDITHILEAIKCEMNQGQFKKLMKNDEIKAFFELYGVTTE